MNELQDYSKILQAVKSEIREGQHRAILAVNRELILLYWNIGRIILKHQQQEGWGGKVIDKLSKDIASEFPQLKGFSSRNLKYMRKFAEENSELGFVQEVLAQITWYHNITLLEKVKDYQERVWYINKTIENGWSRNVLVHQIESKLYQRQVLADKTTNFKSLMPAVQSDLANETLKDPYIFDFIALKEGIDERNTVKTERCISCGN